MSKPVTLKPASERRRDSGSPTYPNPITPILAVRVSMRFMRSCAIFGKTTCSVIDIVTIIASASPEPKPHKSRIDPYPIRLHTNLPDPIGIDAGFRAVNLHNRKQEQKTLSVRHNRIAPEKSRRVEDRWLVISSQELQVL